MHQIKPPLPSRIRRRRPMRSKRVRPSFAKLLDLQMLVSTHGGKERTEAEFAALFAEARLKPIRVVGTPYRVNVVEGVRA
jgi:hypothetical protein